MIHEMKELQELIQGMCKTAKVTFDAFPSGAAVLDIKVNSLLLILEYLPDEGFSVSNVELEEELWDAKKCVIFKKHEFRKAQEYLLEHIQYGHSQS